MKQSTMTMSEQVPRGVNGVDVAVLWEAEQLATDPKESDVAHWVEQVLGEMNISNSEIALKIVDSAEGRLLNKQYRSKDSATNVLSFPSAEIADGCRLLGDIAICAPVVREEAAAQAKSVQAHFAHMVVHGVLHLLGYDHHETAEAEEMEQLERDILRTMNVKDPYLVVGTTTDE